MLKRCEDTKLALNWEKSHFMVKEGIVLGHKISRKGIEVDKAKVDVISKLHHPTTVKGIKNFLGHAGFYRRFIKDFSKISRPITHILEKNTPFIFLEDCILAFQTLKKKLTEAPILIAPNWDQPFEFGAKQLLGLCNRLMMDDPNITMEEYIKLQAEKSQRRARTFNWQTATYGKIYCDDLDFFTDFEAVYLAIVYDDALTSNENVSSESIVKREIHVTWAFTGNTKCGDGVADFKRRRRDFQSDGVMDLTTALGRSRIKVALEDTTWRQPLDETQLEDLGLNTCNHDLPLSSREVPSFDELEPQPQPLPNYPPLDVSLGSERDLKPPIKPHSLDSFRIKVIFDKKKLESS
ncbi:hypothetical protein Tco_0657525 [Tanacetum coccineum]|uniref:Reverse transcriptase domain-containing protein n=1 Tax=Tanacetum coccineum TaxID=301880 RepID=A0ABQ4XBW4_9ASTR